MPSRLIAIGDIHGALPALDQLLAQIQPAATDTLVFLGDVVDRGCCSRQTIDRILELESSTTVIPLFGNHEEMMLRARGGGGALDYWLINGGDATLLSYGTDAAALHLDAIPQAHWDYLESCEDYYETPTTIFVHALYDPDLSMGGQSSQMLRWEKWQNPGPHRSGKFVVCGHTSQRNALPCRLPHAVCIDTYAYGGGWLTALDVHAGTLWQANLRGDHRVIHLEDIPLADDKA